MSPTHGGDAGTTDTLCDVRGRFEGHDPDAAHVVARIAVYCTGGTALEVADPEGAEAQGNTVLADLLRQLADALEHGNGIRMAAELSDPTTPTPPEESTDGP